MRDKTLPLHTDTIEQKLKRRVQTLGGVAIADPRHVAEVTIIDRPPHDVLRPEPQAVQVKERSQAI